LILNFLSDFLFTIKTAYTMRLNSFLSWLVFTAFFISGASLPIAAQTAEPSYRWVYFPCRPDRQLQAPALSAKSIERRHKAAQPLRAFDYPVHPSDLAALRATGLRLMGASRLLNAAVVEVPASGWPAFFAWRSEPLKPLHHCGTSFTDRLEAEEEGLASYQYANGDAAISQINGKGLHDDFFEGQGMLIGVLDGGFRDVDTFGAFSQLRSEGRLVFTKDLVQNDDSVFEDSYHGTMVLSTMAPDLDAVHVGTAPKAQYALFKTENVFSETPLEELHWIRGAELADSLGADVLNTSLGYSTFDDPSDSHTYADMDGRTTPISRAAAALARTGLLLVVSAGNEGNGAWRYITAPADADSVLTVGAVNALGARAGFSSQGPTADGRIKPDVMALGQGCGIINSGGIPSTGSGTSFSGPVMAGIMACLWQKHPSRTAQDLLYSVRLSASQGLMPDTLYGHGIPNLALASTVLGRMEWQQPQFALWSDSEFWIGQLPTNASGTAYISAVGADGRLLGYWEEKVENGAWRVPRSGNERYAGVQHWRVNFDGSSWTARSVQTN
jgi:subtilisin family serine protease